MKKLRTITKNCNSQWGSRMATLWAKLHLCRQLANCLFALLFWEVEMSLFWFDLKTKRDRTPEKARLITKAFFPLARWVGSWNQVIEERIPNEGTWLKLSNCELCYLVLRFFLQALASTENILKHGNLFLAVLWKNKDLCSSLRIYCWKCILAQLWEALGLFFVYPSH